MHNFQNYENNIACVFIYGKDEKCVCFAWFTGLLRKFLSHPPKSNFRRRFVCSRKKHKKIDDGLRFFSFQHNRRHSNSLLCNYFSSFKSVSIVKNCFSVLLLGIKILHVLQKISEALLQKTE